MGVLVLHLLTVVMKCRHLRSSAVCPIWLSESTLSIPRLNIPLNIRRLRAPGTWEARR